MAKRGRPKKNKVTEDFSGGTPLKDISCNFCGNTVPKNNDKRKHNYLSVTVDTDKEGNKIWPTSKIMCPSCQKKHRKVLLSLGYKV